MNLNSLGVGKIFNKVKSKAPMLGTVYGVLGPLAATGPPLGEDALTAVIREITALTNPKIPSIQGLKDFWDQYCKDVAKNGVIAWLAGEFLGQPAISKFGENALKGTLLAAVIGEVGQGGGAPYGKNNPLPHSPEHYIANYEY